MAIKSNYSVTLDTAPLTAVATLSDIYARVSSATIVNRYVRETMEVTVKKTEVNGTLDIYAQATDPSAGIQPLLSVNYACPHVSGVAPDAELYAHIIALPEFAGSVAA